MPSFGLLQKYPPGFLVHKRKLNRLVERTISSREYATITHKGEIFKIGDSYMELVAWIGREGHKQVSDWVIELYDDRFILTSSESEMEIYIPIQ
ncbi:GyrI-like domain-containing protein [Cohnella silvisoli]|uniref:GyrI-like domain-containing protein n=1 Tax=Cohnella silvisoli TaxID=2873699 RepID=UPI00359F5635|nr:GyrI-like domain-containing protein [Cohnella silvisoli]